MKSEVKVLLLGFAPFEKSTFESFFKLVGRRDTLYKAVPEAVQAQVLLVNGDSPAAVKLAQASGDTAQKAIYVGAADPQGRWPNAPRPIKLTTVLGLLDVMVKTISPPASATSIERSALGLAGAPAAASTLRPLVPPTSATPVHAPIAPIAPITPATAFQKNMVRQGSGNRANSGFVASNFMGIGGAAEPKVAAEHFDDILVVDDSDVALKFMKHRLTRYGFRTELAKSGEEALTRVSASNYKFVFLDVMMEGLDGYQTCRAIKQRKYASGRSPVVVMLTSRGGSIDKIRGGLAGCDAYLTKPLNEVELLKILSKYDEEVERSFRDTNVGGSGVA